VLIASNLLLVPMFGFLGAAGAVIITTLFMAIRLNRIVVQKTAIQVSIFAR
jgi:O-antigen/teichoic acid export membrane protein